MSGTRSLLVLSAPGLVLRFLFLVPWPPSAALKPPACLALCDPVQVVCWDVRVLLRRSPAQRDFSQQVEQVENADASGSCLWHVLLSFSAEAVTPSETSPGSSWRLRASTTWGETRDKLTSLKQICYAKIKLHACLEGGREHASKIVQYSATRKKAFSWSEVVFLELLKNRLSISRNSTEEIGKFATSTNT